MSQEKVAFQAQANKPVKALHGAPFTVSVNWGVDGTWRNTSDDFAKTTGITAYNVGKSSSPLFDYYLQITTNQDYDYFFTDASPDTYELNVVDVDDSHIIRYNSDSPTIKYITGK